MKYQIWIEVLLEPPTNDVLDIEALNILAAARILVPVNIRLRRVVKIVNLGDPRASTGFVDAIIQSANQPFIPNKASV